MQSMGAWLREHWRPIGGFAPYAASSLGRVRNETTGHVLTAFIDRYGYHYVNLKRPIKMRVHRLVALAFFPDQQNVLHREVAHLNGDKNDNFPSNLKWVSRGENISHNVLHGVHRGGPRGPSHHSSKVTACQVLEIRKRASAGETGRALAREFGMTSASMSRIIRGAAYSAL